MSKRIIIASIFSVLLAGFTTVAVGSAGFTKSNLSTWFKSTPQTEYIYPLDGADGKDGQDGKDGENGADGVGVVTAEINSAGVLVVTLTDGRVINCGNVVGANGTNGTDGKDGVNGSDGQDGKDGADGVGVVTAEINSAGVLVITLTDGRVIYCGKVVGADGKDGQNGADGQDGADGVNGSDGKDGINGENGSDGKDGQDGKDGVGIATIEKNSAGELIVTLTDGRVINCGKVDGANGSDGQNGTNGENGQDGQNGADGVGVETATINAAGELVITLTNGSEINCGKVVGADGKDGEVSTGKLAITNQSSQNVSIVSFVNGVSTTYTCNAGEVTNITIVGGGVILFKTSCYAKSRIGTTVFSLKTNTFLSTSEDNIVDINTPMLIVTRQAGILIYD